MASPKKSLPDMAIDGFFLWSLGLGSEWMGSKRLPFWDDPSRYPAGRFHEFDPRIPKPGRLSFPSAHDSLLNFVALPGEFWWCFKPSTNRILQSTWLWLLKVAVSDPPHHQNMFIKSYQYYQKKNGNKNHHGQIQGRECWLNVALSTFLGWQRLVFI